MSTNWSSSKSDRYKKLAVSLSLSLASFLTLIKMIAALFSGSLAILSSFMDSLSDVFATVVSFFAVKFSLKPPSCTHRYGYFKAESISALIQSAFIAGSGLFVLFSAAHRLLHGATVEHTLLGIVVMCISLSLTVCVVLFQKYVAKNTKSPAIEADSAHYIADIATNLSVIFSLFAVSYFRLPLIDTLTAFAIAVYLLVYACRIGAKSVSALMDRELPENIKKEVARIVQKTKGVRGFHDFRSRDLGAVYLFELHLEMEPNLSLIEAHRLTQKVETKILKKFQNAQIIIHQDPYGIKEKRLDDILSRCDMASPQDLP
ncbi:MAG: cation diffusion facilitator family transporter [Alphaproteobacteria bacterium]|nr:cation diffusion facilitator family transporter [Alphaproteobacteria bacterium]